MLGLHIGMFVKHGAEVNHIDKCKNIIGKGGVYIADVGPKLTAEDKPIK